MNIKTYKIFLFSFFFCFISCKNDTEAIKNINPEEFKSLMNTDQGLILDVRTPEEFSTGHLEGAKNLNFNGSDFISKVDLIYSKDQPVYIYCRSGGRSYKAAKKMQKLGFKYIFNLKSGISSWIQKGYFVTTTNMPESISAGEFNKIISENSVVLVDFGASWCGPCKKMKPIIEAIEKESTFVKVIFIDIDINKSLADSYNIKKIPTFLVFREGQQIFRHSGLISKKQLLGKIQ